MASIPERGSFRALVCSVLLLICGLGMVFVGVAQLSRDGVVCDGSVTPSGFSCQEYSGGKPVRDIDQIHEEGRYLLGFGLICVAIGGVSTVRNIAAGHGRDDVVVLDKPDNT